jgi:tetratricopeptide (TPR) repeat protein
MKNIDSKMHKQGTPIWTIVALCLAIAAAVWLVFGQTLGHQFVNFDDESYVYANPVVSRGLSWAAIAWAFSHVVSHNWHPLTTISHMLDCQLFDLKPGEHHFTNVLLHTIAAILLLLALYRITGALWRSAFVAAIFAIHPLHVESVAWVSERKDILSAVFFMLILGAYANYVRKPTLPRYAVLSVFFALGLMSKPMLVTVPLVLLILDYWPLERFQNRVASVRTLLIEKIPLLILSIPISVITLMIQRHGINSVENTSLPWRIGNAFVSIAIYLRQLVWPTDLAVFYPHLGNKLPFWQIAVAILLTVALTTVAFVVRKRRPWYLAGWLWYLVMLIPVIGIVQVGSQAHADRYSYLPQIGLYLALTWGIADLSMRWPNRQLLLNTATAVAIILLGYAAWKQTSYWRDSESLWAHALKVTESDLAHERLASALLDKDRPDDAIVQAQLAVNINPSDAGAQNAFGVALARRGQPEAALPHFFKALEADPSLPRLQYNIANVLAAKGDTAQAKMYYENQLRLDPSLAEAHNNLANLFLHEGRFAEAADHLKAALRLKPNYADAHNNIAIVFSQEGRMQDAVEEWKRTLSIEPNNLDAHSNLAWVLATSPSDAIRNGQAALEHAQQALRLSKGSNPRIWRLLAAANAEIGRFDAAVDAAEQALRLAQTENNAALVQTLESNIASFKNSSPLRDYQQSPR